LLASASPERDKRNMREIIFDTETTGLNPAGGDRMVEIGCIELINRVETGKTFHAYFNPDRSMPSEAEAVHGLSTIFLSDKPRFSEKVEELLEFIGDAPLIAHNASFDFGFLNHELERCARDPVCLSRMIDTLILAGRSTRAPSTVLMPCALGLASIGASASSMVHCWTPNCWRRFTSS